MNVMKMCYIYKRVYLPLYKLADTPFHIQGGCVSYECNEDVLYI